MQSNRLPQPMLIVAAALMVAGAMIIVACPHNEPDADRHDWNADKWGMVVPHDTFPADCGLCHITDGWDTIREDFTFDHEKETGYALNGAHANASCLRCHNDRGPVGLFVEVGCGGCHVDPHEAELGMDCTTCHNEITWQPTGMITQHQQTRFPLYGLHLGVPCSGCHAQSDVGMFIGAPTECEYCHGDQATTVTDPDHTSNGWLDGCEECHAATGWIPSHFPHPQFPLSGPHRITCDSCHITPGDYTTFSCTTGCHSQSSTDSKHDEVGGYVYDDDACYDCHKNGKGDD